MSRNFKIRRFPKGGFCLSQRNDLERTPPGTDAYDEFHLSLENVAEVVRVLQDYLDSRPHEECEDDKDLRCVNYPDSTPTFEERLAEVEMRLNAIEDTDVVKPSLDAKNRENFSEVLSCRPHGQTNKTHKITSELQDSLLECKEGILRLCWLNVGWDGYDACQIRLDNAVYAYDIIERLAYVSGKPPPDINPIECGALLLRWGGDGCARVDLRIDAPDEVYLDRSDWKCIKHITDTDTKNVASEIIECLHRPTKTKG